MLANVWAHHQLLEAGDRIQRLEEHLVELDRRKRQLQLEAEYLASPTQIVGRATTELGMQYRTLERTVFASEIE
jgi:cell division protein FtsL